MKQNLSIHRSLVQIWNFSSRFPHRRKLFQMMYGSVTIFQALFTGPVFLGCQSATIIHHQLCIIYNSSTYICTACLLCERDSAINRKQNTNMNFSSLLIFANHLSNQDIFHRNRYFLEKAPLKISASCRVIEVVSKYSLAYITNPCQARVSLVQGTFKTQMRIVIGLLTCLFRSDFW